MRGFLKNEVILWVRKHVGAQRGKDGRIRIRCQFSFFGLLRGFIFRGWVWVAHNYFSPVVLHVVLCDLVSLQSYPAFFFLPPKIYAFMFCNEEIYYADY